MSEHEERYVRDALTGERLPAKLLLLFDVRAMGQAAERKPLPRSIYSHTMAQATHTKDNALGHLEYTRQFERYIDPERGPLVQEALRLWYTWWTEPYLVGRLYAHPERFERPVVQAVVAKNGDEHCWDICRDILTTYHKPMSWLRKHETRMTYFLREHYIRSFMLDVAERIR